jgi:hypothetical protein
MAGIYRAILPIVTISIVQGLNAAFSHHALFRRTRNVVVASGVVRGIVASDSGVAGVDGTADAVFTRFVIGGIDATTGVRTRVDGTGDSVVTVDPDRRIQAVQDWVAGVRRTRLIIVAYVGVWNVDTGVFTGLAFKTVINRTSDAVIAE